MRRRAVKPRPWLVLEISICFTLSGAKLIKRRTIFELRRRVFEPYRDPLENPLNPLNPSRDQKQKRGRLILPWAFSRGELLTCDAPYSDVDLTDDDTRVDLTAPPPPPPGHPPNLFHSLGACDDDDCDDCDDCDEPKTRTRVRTAQPKTASHDAQVLSPARLLY